MNNTDVYSYNMRLFFNNAKDNSSTEIPEENISSILIDKNYEDLNQPVIILSVSLNKKLLDEMIRTQEDSLLSLQIFKKNDYEEHSIGDCILEDLFIYMTEKDVSNTQDIDYPENMEEREDLFRTINLYLLKRDTVNAMNQVINTVLHCTYKGINKIPISMTDLVMRVSNYFNSLLLEPLQYNESFDQVIIPPVTTVSEYLEYLNDNIYTFYDSGYRFFVDFDTAYIISKSGIKVPHIKQKSDTVIFNIGNLLDFANNDRGLYFDKETNHYHIPIGLTSTKFTTNVFTKRLVTKVSSVTSSGDAYSNSIKENETLNNKIKTKIINTTNSNPNLVNNITNDLSMSNIILDINKPDLDADIFTINKEYLVQNSDEHKEYNGRYLLCSVKQVYLKQNNKFIMSTVLRLKKINNSR